MRRHYTLAPEAEEDLNTIYSYLRSASNVKTARFVLKELKEALQFLAQMPGAGHSREDIVTEPLKFWPVFSYLIAYNPEKSPIEVVRIIHGSRDMPKLLGSKSDLAH